MLGQVLVAVLLSIVWAVVALPLLVFGGRWARRVPERVSRRAVPIALGVGAWSGPLLGVAAVVFWGSSIQSEAAGEIALILFGLCSVVGGAVAAIFVWYRLARRAPQ